MIKIHLLLIGLMLMLTTAATAQQATEFQFKIRGLKTPSVILGYHYGDQTFKIDSVGVDTSTGQFALKSDKKLPEGIYFAATTEGGIFMNFIVAGEPKFQISTDYTAVYDSANVDNSVENTVFFNYRKTEKRVYDEIRQMQQMQEMLARATKDKQILAEYQNKIREKAKELDKEALRWQQKYPNLFTTKWIKATQEVPPPTTIPPSLDGKTLNPNYAFYIRQHYFDNIDFADERMLRTTALTNAMQSFLSNAVAPQADSIRTYLDMVLAKSRSSNLTVYQFSLRWLTNFFDNNLVNIHNGDAFLVHLVEKYHHSADAGTDKYTLERLDYKANLFRPNLIGNFAPPISLPDTEGVERRLVDLKSDFSLVIFYSSMCPHCREAMPKILAATQYTDTVKLKIMTVCTDGMKEPWLQFVREVFPKNWVNVLDKDINTALQKQYATFNLPVLYLLDKDKKIVAKRIKADDLAEILRGVFK